MDWSSLHSPTHYTIHHAHLPCKGQCGGGVYIFFLLEGQGQKEEGRGGWKEGENGRKAKEEGERGVAGRI